MCYDDSGNEVDCPPDYIYTKANWIKCPQPIAPVSTEPGAWRCHEDVFGIIQCEEYIYYVEQAPGTGVSLTIYPDYLTLEVPDMNGDGTIDQRDKVFSDLALRSIRSAKLTDSSDWWEKWIALKKALKIYQIWTQDRPTPKTD